MNAEQKPEQTTPRRRSLSAWLATIVELLIIVTCVIYLLTVELWSLVLWETVTGLYLIVGLALIWNGRINPDFDHQEAAETSKWFWAPPLVASLAGVNSAVIALTKAGSNDEGTVTFVLLSCLGIALSWALLQVGFAQIYRTIDTAFNMQGIEFPGEKQASTLDYMYFSFTLGTSFATSDAEVVQLRIRRIVLVHSIISFFFNALVVAVIFQVLQGLAK